MQLLASSPSSDPSSSESGFNGSVGPQVMFVTSSPSSKPSLSLSFLRGLVPRNTSSPSSNPSPSVSGLFGLVSPGSRMPLRLTSSSTFFNPSSSSSLSPCSISSDLSSGFVKSVLISNTSLVPPPSVSMRVGSVHSLLSSPYIQLLISILSFNPSPSVSPIVGSVHWSLFSP